MSGHRASAAVSALVVGVLLAGCSGSSSNPVVVGEVRRATVAEVVEAPGTVAARGSATVSSPADGTVAAVYVAEGDQVARGDRLMLISSPSAQAALTQAREADAQVASSSPGTAPSGSVSASVGSADAAAARAFAQATKATAAIPDPTTRRAAQAQLAAAKAQYAAARAAVARATAQLDAGIGSASSAAAALTRAQRVQTQAAVAAAQRTVDALTIRAPISGVVTLTPDAATGSGSGTDLSSLVSQLPQSQQGAASALLGGTGSGTTSTGTVARGVPVSSGQPLATVTDLSRLTLAAQVDETDVLLVKVGTPAKVELAAVPGATYRGRVTAVSLSATTSSRGGVSYVVRLALGPGRTVDGRRAPTPRPGMSAVARLEVLTARNTTAVPAAAVFQEGARSSVWLVQDGVARLRPVRLGAQGEATYQILSGVQVGDTVVIRGADQVREGQSVG